MSDRKLWILLVGLAAAIAPLAGCAEPEEADEPDVVDPGVDDGMDVNDTDDMGDDPNATADMDTVMIDGALFTCDDTVQLDPAGPCESYVLDETADPAAYQGEQYTSADGQVDIAGTVYTCDDTVQTGPICEEWIIAAEA